MVRTGFAAKSDAAHERRAPHSAKKGAITKSTARRVASSRAGCVSQKEEVIARIIEHHRCPITKELLVDPVVAEDGHVYEGSALKRWLQTKQKSPVTNKPMGPQAMPAVSARQTVSELLESGFVDDRTMMRFYLARARLRASRSVVPGPELEGAREDFLRAADLGRKKDSSVEFQMSVVDWMMRGVELCSRSKSMNEEVKRWILEVGNAVRFAVTWPLSQRMTTWLALQEGTCVRVIDDAAELEQLCERPPPGATAKVKWNPDMRSFAGNVCVVKSMGPPSHMNYVLTRAGASFSFPYDALFLLL